MESLVIIQKKIEVPEDVKEKNKNESLDKLIEKEKLSLGQKVFIESTWYQPTKYKKSLIQKEKNYIAQGSLKKKDRIV